MEANKGHDIVIFKINWLPNYLIMWNVTFIDYSVYISIRLKGKMFAFDFELRKCEKRKEGRK